MNLKVLIITPDADLNDRLGSLRMRHRPTVLLADTGMKGLNIARRAQPDVIVIDEELTDLDGSCVCAILRTQLSTRHIPIIVLVPQPKLFLCGSLSTLSGLEFLPRTVPAETLGEHVLNRVSSESEQAEPEPAELESA